MARSFARIVVGAGACGLLALSMTTAAAAAAAAPTVVTTWDGLVAAFTSGGQVELGADLSRSDGQSLTVGASVQVLLDLDGHQLSITQVAPQTAAIDVSGDSALVIKDSAGGGELTAIGTTGGSGIGSAQNHDAGTITIDSGTVHASVADPKFTGLGGPGIGASGYGKAGAVFIRGGDVVATGLGYEDDVDNDGGAGVGGGDSSAGYVEVTGGQLTATGNAGGSGIGANSLGNYHAQFQSGGGLFVGPNATVETNGLGADDSDGDGSLISSVVNDGTLILNGSQRLSDRDTIVNNGTLEGDGTISNRGSIIGVGTVVGWGTGNGGALLVQENNYLLQFHLDGGSDTAPIGGGVITPLTGRIFTPDAASAENEQGPAYFAPATPPKGKAFKGWFSAPSGGVRLDESSNLPSLFGSGPRTVPIYAQYGAPAHLTSSVTPAHPVYGQVIHATVTVQSASGTPRGSLTIERPGNDPVTINLTKSRSVSLVLAGGSLKSAPYGFPEVDFTASAASTVGSASIDIPYEVTKASTQIHAAARATYLTATVDTLAPGGGTPTKTVTFSVDGTAVGTCTLATTTVGRSLCHVNTPLTGHHTVTANYSGDLGHKKSSATFST